MGKKKKEEMMGEGIAMGKAAAMEDAVARIRKQYGQGAIMKLSDARCMNVERISTGTLSLDMALGGGIPKGRIIEIYGPESGGKTTLALNIIAEVQQAGGLAGFVDAEHALDPEYASNIGVDIDDLYISQPDSGEQALEITETMVRSGAIDVIVIDSVAALVPQAEIDGEMGDAHVGLQARLMSQALRKLTAAVSQTGCILIFINQIRDKVGVTWGSSETTTGGRALKFYSSVRIDVRRLESIKKGSDIIGNRVRVKITKNKVAPPFKTTDLDIIFGEGVSNENDVFDLALERKLITRSGAWYNIGDQSFQGEIKAIQYIHDNPSVYEMLKDRIMEMSKEKRAEDEDTPDIPITGEEDDFNEDDLVV